MGSQATGEQSGTGDDVADFGGCWLTPQPGTQAATNPPRAACAMRPRIEQRRGLVTSRPVRTVSRSYRPGLPAANGRRDSPGPPAGPVLASLS
jgi:hypothetical protein